MMRSAMVLVVGISVLLFSAFSAFASSRSVPRSLVPQMFLYEERLGAAQPTTVPGSVKWSIDMRTDAKGRSDPVIQAHIDVPKRHLTAVLTLERNSDPSVSASHLIELSFQIAPGFKRGGIYSLRHMSMKAMESDRGDALIAVPAKVTDNLYMLALNDLPEARAKNLELLECQWIDLPISYQDGGRALVAGAL